MTPPSVTNLRSMNSLRSARPRSKSASVSGRSSSPDSFGFPEAIYIPRSRPLERDLQYPGGDLDESSILPEPSIIGESSMMAEPSVIDEPPSAERIESMIIEPVSPRPKQPPESERAVRPRHAHRPTQSSNMDRSIVWSGPFNPTPEVPHLSQDRGYAPYFYKWRAPSIEESQSLFGSINRQVLLFCCGFVFPLGKLAPSADIGRTILMQGSLDVCCHPSCSCAPRLAYQ